MTRSANEVMALAAKAARGGGAPPAQAADFGKAVVCHLCARRSEAQLEDALGALPKGPILTLPVAFAQLAEMAEGGTVKGVIGATGWEALVESYADALPFEHKVDAGAGTFEVTLDLTTPAARVKVTRVIVPDALFDLMTALAAKTYVPESETSRLAGAGAGLTDND